MHGIFRKNYGLDDNDFHWFLVFGAGDVAYSGIAFSANGIDIDPVGTADNKFGEAVDHFSELDIGEHAFEDAVVHSGANGFEEFDHIVSASVVADVVGLWCGCGSMLHKGRTHCRGKRKGLAWKEG